MDPLGQGQLSLLLRQAIAVISSSAAIPDLQTLAQRLARDLPGSANYLQIYGVARQALAITGAGAAAQDAGGSLTGPPAPPVDTSLPAGGPEYQVRVIVTATLPDGSTRNTVVPIQFSGPLTAEQAIARAIAEISSGMGAALPPPVFGQVIPIATFSGSIYTIGRARSV